MLEMLSRIEERVVEFMQRMSQCHALTATEKVAITDAVRKDLRNLSDNLLTINASLDNIQSVRESIIKERQK